MRSIVYKKIQLSFLIFIVSLVITNSVSSFTISAQEESKLIIEIYDSNNWNESVGNILFEGRSYDIIVISSENESVVLDVNISFFGAAYDTYLTNEAEPFITIVAPSFNTSESYAIRASKDGYLTNEVELIIYKGQLLIDTDRASVEEEKGFQVTIRDQDDEPVADALVYITPDADPFVTNLQGIVYAHAPTVEETTTVNIQVVKNGYFPTSTNIRVENVEGFPINLNNLQFLQILPILLAIIVVIFAIVYVFWRQKRTLTISSHITRRESTNGRSRFQQEQKEQSLKNERKLFSEKEKENISVSTHKPRVEEIRIPVQVKKKETTFLSNKDKFAQISNDKISQQDEWFKGQNYIRFKIDELTGKIDQKTDGKWFEGETDSKNKIDEALHKSVKKKKSNEKYVK